MLEFFRKYQRFFFLVVTTIIILSFTFFGTFSTFTNDVEIKDRSIGKAIDGSDLLLFEQQKLSRFLSMDVFDTPSVGNGPNFLNDGVIRKDLIAVGLADLLVQSYFEPLKEELAVRLAQAKRFTPYSHPKAPFISVQSVWDQFNPEMGEELAALKAEVEVSPMAFSRLAKLYLQQGRIPPELMRRILLYQMNQYSWVPMDPEIQYGDLSLFGYHSVKDWFGGQFVDLSAQFIHNCSIAAKEMGFHVSPEEAKANLLINFEQAMDGLKQHKREPITFAHQLRLLGMSEKEAVAIWQEVLLFRKYFDGIGDSVLIDQLPFKELSAFAKETAVTRVYTLPDSLVLRTADDLFELQYYLEAVGVPEKETLALPTAYRSLDEIEKRAPELVETQFKAQVRQVSKQEISLKASLKETVQWELDHWDLLSKKFPTLSKTSSDREARFIALDRIGPLERVEIDSWARLQLVEEHPEWVAVAFQTAPAKEQTLSLSSNRINLKFIQDVAKFERSLNLAAEGDVEAQKLLSSYSDDPSVIYSFEEIQKISSRQVRTLSSVKKDGTLREITERHLEQSYPKIRGKNPTQFQTEGGDWRPFSEVKEAVGKELYATIFKAIDAKEKTDKKPINFYVSHRLAETMRHAAREIQQTQMDPKGLEQFKIVTQEKKLQRTAQENWMNNEAFMLIPNQWSPVHVPDNGHIIFFYLQERIFQQEPILSQLEAGRETLSRETKKALTKRMLNRIRNKNAVTLPMQKEDDHV